MENEEAQILQDAIMFLIKQAQQNKKRSLLLHQLDVVDIFGQHSNWEISVKEIK